MIPAALHYEPSREVALKMSDPEVLADHATRLLAASELFVPLLRFFVLSPQARACPPFEEIEALLGISRTATEQAIAAVANAIALSIAAEVDAGATLQ